MANILSNAEGMRVYCPVKGDFGKGRELVKVVDGVPFEAQKGEVFGVVGESGCGKSTLGRGICKLETPVAGKIVLSDESISSYGRKQVRSVRREIQMILQDPYASLNPRMSIFDIIVEPLVIHGLTKSRRELEDRVMELLRRVGLDDYHADRYPHEFSGGRCQRIGVARVLAVKSELIIADGLMSALDISIQAQVLSLLRQLQKEFNLAYIFVAHDLDMVEHISDQVGVMYLDNFVGMGDKRKLYNNPLYPYTQALLPAVSIPDPTAKKDRIILEGNTPSALNPPDGCKFYIRYPRCMDVCKKGTPEHYQVSDDHYVYCHLYDDKVKESKG